MNSVSLDREQGIILTSPDYCGIEAKRFYLHGVQEFSSNASAIRAGLPVGDCFFASDDHPIGYPALLRVVAPKPLLIRTLIEFSEYPKDVLLLLADFCEG